ncbi:MAG: type II/IV secretion system protein, partial [Calditrichaeota bacterium]
MHYNDEMVEILKLLPADYALRNGFSPVEVTRGRLKIAVSNQNYQNLIDEIEFIVERTILVETKSREEVLGQIANLYGINLENWEEKGQEYLPVEKEHINLSDSDIFGDDKHSVVPFVNRLISEAIRERASDIHLERYEGIFRIRFRIDGALIEHLPPYSAYPEMIISRLKIMAGMDIAEKRRPQDGRIRMENHQSKIDLRVSTLPTEFGEKMVLRILNKQAVALSLDSLGFDKKLLADLTKVLNLPYGMILLTGPTGSGKTTTLYSALNFLNKTDVNIISIEDPIEYNLSGINQIRVRPDLNLNFAAILRTILRQDPDVIMVGEIRDTETAEIAVRAALTGHLVLSTLHTNDSLSTLIRLIDMGIDPFLIAHSLKMVIAQRLIR